MNFEIYVSTHSILGLTNIWRQEWALHLCPGQVHALFLVGEVHHNVEKNKTNSCLFWYRHQKLLGCKIKTPIVFSRMCMRLGLFSMSWWLDSCHTPTSTTGTRWGETLTSVKCGLKQRLIQPWVLNFLMFCVFDVWFWCCEMTFLHFLDLPQPHSNNLLSSLQGFFLCSFYFIYRFSASELVARILTRERADYLIVM